MGNLRGVCAVALAVVASCSSDESPPGASSPDASAGAGGSSAGNAGSAGQAGSGGQAGNGGQLGSSGSGGQLGDASVPPPLDGGGIDALTLKVERATPEQIGMHLTTRRAIAAGSRVNVRYRAAV